MFDFGSLVMIAFMAIGFVGIVIGYYTQAGSGITARPYYNRYGGAPGAWGASDVSGKDHRERVDWSRGTR
jgi:hypothetical protein